MKNQIVKTTTSFFNQPINIWLIIRTIFLQNSKVLCSPLLNTDVRSLNYLHFFAGLFGKYKFAVLVFINKLNSISGLLSFYLIYPFLNVNLRRLLFSLNTNGRMRKQTQINISIQKMI